jgi:dTDP-glucose 4,6-dehydratase
MSHSKILVTGADGFIGSHLTELLVRQGYDVRAFVYYNSFNSWGWLDHAPADIKAEIDVFAGDVRDPHGVHTAMRDCSAVCHLAALIGIPYSYHSPASYVETNITGTLNVLQAAHNENVEKVVQTSTSEVYGTAQFVPITEDHPRRGQSPYAATKIGADELALSFFHSFDTPVTVLRPFNTYGPRQSARAVIPTLITQMLAGKRQVKLGATEPTRDFNFVADVARAFVAALTKDAAIGEVINIGSNFEISVGDTARIIAGASGVDVEIVTDAERLRPARSEIERLWADNAKARELLGWTPEYGGLDGFRRGIVETIEWFRDPANLARYKTDLYAI